jgi:hypothetical protein
MFITIPEHPTNSFAESNKTRYIPSIKLPRHWLDYTYNFTSTWEKLMSISLLINPPQPKMSSVWQNLKVKWIINNNFFNEYSISCYSTSTTTNLTTDHLVCS